MFQLRDFSDADDGIRGGEDGGHHGGTQLYSFHTPLD